MLEDGAMARSLTRIRDRPYDFDYPQMTPAFSMLIQHVIQYAHHV